MESKKRIFEFSRTQSIYIFIIIISIGMFLDFSKIYFIEVSVNYLYLIFNSIISLSVLGISLLTLIIHLLDKVYFGYSLKVILKTNKTKLSLNMLIPSTLLISFLSYIFVSIIFVNSLIAMFYITIFTLFNYSILIMSSLTNEDYLITLVEEMILSTKKEGYIDYSYLKTILDYYRKLNENESFLKVEYLLKRLSTSLGDKDKRNFERDIKEFLTKTIQEKGVFYTYKYLNSIFSIVESTTNSSLKFDVLEDLYKTIEISSEIEINKLKLINVLDNISNITNLNPDQIRRIFYICFENIYNNEIIGIEFKFRVLDALISVILNFVFEIEDNTLDDLDVILQIIKNFIILNMDLQKSIRLLNIINIKIKRVFNKESLYYKFLALNYFTFYVYCELENETLEYDQRQKIRFLFSSKGESISLSKVSIKSTIHNNFPRISLELWNLIPFIDDFSYIDYFPIQLDMKSTTWSEESLSNFAFANMFLNEDFYEFKLENLYKNYYKSDERKLKIKNVLSNLASNHIDNNNKLKTLPNDRIQNISSFIELPILEKDLIQKVMSGMINNELIYLEKSLKFTKMSKPLDLSQIRRQLTLKFSKKSQIFNASLTDQNSELLNLKLIPIIDKKDFLNNFSIRIPQIEMMINLQLNKLISNHLKIINVPYNLDGIIELESLMKKESLYMISSNLIPIFKRFKDKQNIESSKMPSVQIFESYPLHSKIIMKEKALNYRVYLKNINQRVLSSLEANEFADQFKVNEQTYRLNGVFYSQIQILEKILREYSFEEIVVEVYMKIEYKNVYQVKLMYS